MVLDHREDRPLVDAEPVAVDPRRPLDDAAVLEAREAGRGVELGYVAPKSGAHLWFDLLAIPADRRTLADLGAAHRIAPGVTLPAPTAVFPRYVEPEEPKKT